MKLLPLILAFWGQALLSSAESPLLDETKVYISPLSATSTPTLLAEISYNPSTLSASISSFEPPELSPDFQFARIGIFDPAAQKWKSATSLTSAESFAKGYRPTIVLNLNAQGDVLGVSVSSGKIDAGQTRDFGPKVVVKRMEEQKGPELNKPVVLSPEGKVATPEPEKTMLQK
jgi:hypothetical protein